VALFDLQDEAWLVIYQLESSIHFFKERQSTGLAGVSSGMGLDGEMLAYSFAFA